MKRGGGSFSMLKPVKGGGGDNKFCGSIYMVGLSLSHIEGKPKKVFTLQKGGHK